ncbi:hypothetical protein CMO96_00630 [Candidatus Woesebacteria bacterium]|nr:hypothetical protein [Candidatus Woesebacteria bacterium]
MEEQEQELTKKERRLLAKEQKREEQESTERKSGLTKFVIGLVVVGLLAVGGWWFWGEATKPVPGVSQETQVSQIEENDWVKGSTDAKITLIEYGDFQCPACGSYAPLVKQLGQEFSDDLKIAYRHFPLTNIHQNAMPAARATEAAGKQGKFWEMHDLLFERQTEWSKKPNPEVYFLSLASELELDGEVFLEDYKSGEFDDKIKGNIASGIASRVNETPSFFLNGEKIRVAVSYEAFKALVEEAME